jgi:hypothetical protein
MFNFVVKGNRSLRDRGEWSEGDYNRFSAGKQANDKVAQPRRIFLERWGC